MAEADPPPGFDELVAAVSRINTGGDLRFYPGSPMLIAAALRPGDRLLACELRLDDHARLADLLQPLQEQASALREDGYLQAAQCASHSPLFVHIDPPFERGEDYARAADTASSIARRNPSAVVMIWLPLKDLETFDGFLRRLEEGNETPALVVECRLRPLDDPTRLNGCALVILNPPAGLQAPLREICLWTAQAAGAGAGEARVWDF
jgi:23S rRNA (adenine2030-N6)-methyltransferase